MITADGAPFVGDLWNSWTAGAEPVAVYGRDSSARLEVYPAVQLAEIAGFLIVPIWLSDNLFIDTMATEPIPAGYYALAVSEAEPWDSIILYYPYYQAARTSWTSWEGLSRGPKQKPPITENAHGTWEWHLGPVILPAPIASFCVVDIARVLNELDEQGRDGKALFESACMAATGEKPSDWEWKRKRQDAYKRMVAEKYPDGVTEDTEEQFYADCEQFQREWDRQADVPPTTTSISVPQLYYPTTKASRAALLHPGTLSGGIGVWNDGAHKFGLTKIAATETDASRLEALCNEFGWDRLRNLMNAAHSMRWAACDAREPAVFTIRQILTTMGVDRPSHKQVNDAERVFRELCDISIELDASQAVQLGYGVRNDPDTGEKMDISRVEGHLMYATIETRTGRDSGETATVLNIQGDSPIFMHARGFGQIGSFPRSWLMAPGVKNSRTDYNAVDSDLSRRVRLYQQKRVKEDERLAKELDRYRRRKRNGGPTGPEPRQLKSFNYWVILLDGETDEARKESVYGIAGCPSLPRVSARDRRAWSESQRKEWDQQKKNLGKRQQRLREHIARFLDALVERQELSGWSWRKAEKAEGGAYDAILLEPERNRP